MAIDILSITLAKTCYNISCSFIRILSVKYCSQIYGQLCHTVYTGKARQIDLCDITFHTNGLCGHSVGVLRV